MNEYVKMIVKKTKEYIDDSSFAQKEKDKYIDLLIEILKTCYLKSGEGVYEPIITYSIAEISLLHSNKIHTIRRLWQLRKELGLINPTLRDAKEYVEKVEKAIRNKK